jgi:hypothetical protein
VRTIEKGRGRAKGAHMEGGGREGRAEEPRGGREPRARGGEKDRGKGRERAEERAEKGPSGCGDPSWGSGGVGSGGGDRAGPPAKNRRPSRTIDVRRAASSRRGSSRPGPPEAPEAAGRPAANGSHCFAVFSSS